RGYSEVEGKLDAACEDGGEQKLKNIAKPVRAYAVRAGAHSALIDGLSAAPPLPDKPSIAVLPFENMSGDPEQEYFADGMVEEIVTALSRFKDGRLADLCGVSRWCVPARHCLQRRARR